MISRKIKNWLKEAAEKNRTFFGFRIVTEEDAEKMRNSEVKRANLIAEKEGLQKRVSKLEHENRNLQSIVKIEEDLKTRKTIDPFMGDPSPVDTEQRKLYVAQVAGLHKDILEPKLRHMIAKSFTMLEESTNDREFDQAVKGTIYALREIIRWGESMLNEQLANQIGDSGNTNK